MRLQTALPLLAVAPLAVSAAGRLGWALGQTNPDGSCKKQSDYEADMATLKEKTGSSIVRTYASGGTCQVAAAILPAAKIQGFQVVLGSWPDESPSIKTNAAPEQNAPFQADLQAMKEQVPKFKDQVYAITIGSETQYRGNLSATTLLGYIDATRNADEIKNAGVVKVGTADTWNVWQNGSMNAFLDAHVNFLLINAFAYWQGAPIENATATYLDDIGQAYAHIQAYSATVDGGAEIWTGETGWPTDGGSDYQSSKAGTANAESFYKHGVCAALDWGFDVFYFEAFDETGKLKSVGDDKSSQDETHWGAFFDTRDAKFDLTC